MKKVIKRDGNEQEFNVEKIKRAIKKASNSLDKEYQISDEEIQEMAESISFETADDDEIDIEKIQDLVEKELMENGHYEIAKSYILYRDQRAKERFKRTKIIKEIRQKLDGKVNEKQNANVDEESFGGRKGESADLLVKEMALDYYVTPKMAKNHRENRIYLHDLNSYAVGLHNCLQLPLDDLLKNGVVVKDSDIRPAGSLNSAEQISAVFMQIQSLEQFGGVSYGSFDSAMVPYVRKSFQKHYKDGLKYIKKLSDEKINKFFKEPIKSIEEKRLKKNKRVYNYAMNQTINESDQAAEALFHNLNTLLSRSGSQLPFSSICFGTEKSLEGKIVCNSIYKTSIKGIGKYGRTSIFPCQIFKYNKDINGKEGTPNYSLFKNSIDSTTRRLYPNYANTHWSVQMKGIKYDRSIKKEALLKLKQEDIAIYHSLYNWIMNNPDEARRMNLAIDDYNVIVLDEIMPSEEFATMGCLDYNENVKINGEKIKIGDFVELIECLYNNRFLVEKEMFYKKTLEIGKYYIISKHFGDVEIYDNTITDPIYLCKLNIKDVLFSIEKEETDNSVLYRLPKNKWNITSGNTVTGLNTVLYNKVSTEWLKITYKVNDEEKTVTATIDHPFVKFGDTIETRADNLKIGDKLEKTDRNTYTLITNIEKMDKADKSYDVSTDDEHFNINDEIYSHNCRTNNGFDINFTVDYFIDLIKETVKNHKIPENYLLSAAQRDGRGNIAPSTIILPTLAMEAKKKTKNNPEEIVSCFMDILDTAINDCKDGLIERFNWIAAQSPNSGKFMYKNNTMKGYIPEEGIRSALKHGTLAIGQIGLAETLQILIGCDQTNKKGLELAKKIEQLFMDKCNDFKHKWYFSKKFSEKEIFSQICEKIRKRGEVIDKNDEKEILSYIKTNTPADLLS